MRFYLSIIVISFLQIVSVGCIGQFYVGILGYNNNNPTCCSRNSCENTVSCSYIFEIVVDSLNSSLGPVSRRPSNKALSASQATAFPGESVTNPLSFQFNKWPGGAEVTINVLDGETELLVDQFNDSIELYTPSSYYVYNSLVDDTNTSSIVLVFRYGCEATIGPPCFTDCADHMKNETCPGTTPIPPDIITFTGFAERKCTTTDADGTTVGLNCTTGTPTTSAGMENETIDTSTSLSPTTASPTTTSPTLTSPESAMSSDITRETSQITSTSHTLVVSSTETRNNLTITKKYSTKPDVRTKISEQPKTDSRDPRSDDVTTSTTPGHRIASVDENPTAYWPGIVGGVLGGVAVFAAAAFICYWNRQKKLQKRQEIYNVNPKILRNFEEFEENGTSGRADVPMETEQY